MTTGMPPVVEITADTMSAAFDRWDELWAGIENPPGTGDGIAEATSVLEQLREIVGISDGALEVLFERIKAEIPSLEEVEDTEEMEIAGQRLAITAAVMTLLALNGEQRLRFEAEMS